MSSLAMLRLLAHRFVYGYTDSGTRRTVQKPLVICFITITLCTALTALIMGICVGFEHAMRSRLKAIHADVTIYGNDNMGDLDVQKITHVLNKEFSAYIEAVTPSSGGYAYLDNGSLHKPVVIKAIDVATFSKVIPDHQWDHLDLASISESHDILIGTGIARDLGMKRRDSAQLIVVVESSTIPASSSSVPVKIAGQASTGIADIDTHLVVLPLTLFTAIFGKGAGQLLIKTKSGIDESALAQTLEERFNLPVRSWQEAYPAFASVTKLCHRTGLLISFCLLILTLVSVYALMRLFIQDKERDTAVLAALGMSRLHSSLLLFSISTLLTAASIICGMMLSLFCAYCIQHYHLFQLPNGFSLASSALIIDWPLACALAACIFLCSLTAVVIPIIAHPQQTLATIMRRRQ